MNANKYDCTKDVKEHQERVRYWLNGFIDQLKSRSENHDKSKLADPDEKALFDHWTPELRSLTWGTDEYKLALDGMGEGVKKHYKANRHHPEHYDNGVDGMTLVDIIEMVADWMAAAQAKDTFVDLTHAADRFGISKQLIEIIANTLYEGDLWNIIGGANIVELCPPDMRDRGVDGFEKSKGNNTP